MKRYLPLFANIASQVLFGFAYLFIKLGMDAVGQDTIKFLSFRFGLGFLVMTVLLLFGFQKVHYRKRPICLVVLCGLVNPLISQVLETTSTIYAPTSQLSMYLSIVPALMLFFSVAINREYPTRRQVLFLFVTVFGIFTAKATADSGGEISPAGFILVMASMTVIALGRVLVRRASAYFTSFEIVYITTGMGAIGFTAAAFLRAAASGTTAFQYFAVLSDKQFVIAVLYMGIGSCAGAFLLMTYAAANLPAAVYAATCSFSTVIGILSGVLILGESFRCQEILGAALILAGMIGIGMSYQAEGEENRFKIQKR